MKGTSHGLIGLATAAATQHINISAIATGPEKALPFLFAYVGALLPDLDIGNSTISNAINPIKKKYVINLVTAAYVISSIAAIIYFRQKYPVPTLIVLALTGISLGSIAGGAFKVLRKVMVIAVSVGIGAYGVYSGQLSLTAAGAFLLAVSFSPHRGYSHSLLAVAAAYFISKAVFTEFHIPDCSIALSVGMLSHLGADMVTERGIPLMFPYGKKLSLPLTTKTGSIVEGVISVMAAFVLVASLMNIKLI